MEFKDKIKILVSIHDHRAIEIPAKVPDYVKDIRLLQSTVDKYAPSFQERCQQVTNSLLYLNYIQLVPNATKTQFFNQFMSTHAGLKSFAETLAFVTQKLPERVPVEELEKILKQ